MVFGAVDDDWVAFHRGYNPMDIRMEFIVQKTITGSQTEDDMNRDLAK